MFSVQSMLSNLWLASIEKSLRIKYPGMNSDKAEETHQDTNNHKIILKV